MARIFISYANEDRDYATLLAHNLREAGQEVLMDDVVLSPGEKWGPKLDQALKSSEVVLFLISKASIEKANTTLEFARALGYAESTGRILLIPVLIEDFKPPGIINQIQYLSVFDREIHEYIPSLLSTIARFEAQKVETEIRLEKVETDLSTFVEEAITQQREYESMNKTSAKWWYFLGVVFLLLGLGGTAFLAYRVIDGATLTIPSAVSMVILDVVSIGILASLAKYAYSLGKSFMTESLKSADRVHAMQFGKFYLRAFGGRLTPVEVKDAFQHWNIDRSSTFASLDAAQIDPQIISLVSQVISSTMGKKT